MVAVFVVFYNGIAGFIYEVENMLVSFFGSVVGVGHIHVLAFVQFIQEKIHLIHICLAAAYAPDGGMYIIGKGIDDIKLGEM
ncbi:MAG: hypothetical protein K0Q79_593 [Flavipsychrobacter sp.]|nr:hypothetical protein [Flavipsychrobacter sp.]